MAYRALTESELNDIVGAVVKRTADGRKFAVTEALWMRARCGSAWVDSDVLLSDYVFVVGGTVDAPVGAWELI